MNEDVEMASPSQIPSKSKRLLSSDESSDGESVKGSHSSSWEDQESSDDNKLKIDLNNKRKVRRKRLCTKPSSARKISKEIHIPDDVLAECSSLLSMDQKLDAKAKSINWGTKQVKMVLRAIVQSEEMMIMLRNAGLATGEKQPQQQPKMTRAMTKKVVEAGGEVVPFIMAKATPVKSVDRDIHRLFTEDLHEEENDPEYNPELDAYNMSDDDESLVTSEQSEVGTPHTQNTDSRLSGLGGLATPTSSRRPTPDQFKRPFRSVCGDRQQASRSLDFDTEEVSGAGRYSTRSRVPMTDTALEEIEQLFVPPDITPDMYEMAVDNDDYSEFLKELYGSGYTEPNTGTGLEDLDLEDDPEFVYCPDEADKFTKDPEELRNDKATKITKKEVADLMAELLEEATNDNDIASKKKHNKRKKAQLPGEAIYEAVKEHTENSSVKVSVEPPTSAAPDYSQAGAQHTVEETWPCLTVDQKRELDLQVQQHIQLLTQMSLLTSHNPMWVEPRRHCDTMLSQLLGASLAHPHSSASQPNLLTSMSVIRDWDISGSDPTHVTKNKNSKKHKKRNMNFNISKPLFKFMSSQSVFYFPALLPVSALAQDEARIMWTNSEDHLLAFAMRESVPLAKKPGLMELSFALQKRFMPAKTVIQIRARIKNLKLREEDNPVSVFIRSGELGRAAVQHTWAEVGNGTKTLMEMFAGCNKCDFPAVWVKALAELGWSRSRQVMISARPAPPAQLILLSPAKLTSCAVQLRAGVSSLPSPAPPILCVDGNNTTPTSASDTETSDQTPGPPVSSAMSPVKRILGSHSFQKSPLKAAGDRILKKYTSPLKRSPFFGNSPQRRPLRELRKRSLPGSPQVLTPTRRLPTLAPKSAERPAGLEPALSPKSPCLQSPCQEGDGTPSNAARRKTRHQKETELTLALVGPLETQEEKEAREARESQEMFQEITKALADSADGQKQFASIMSTAATVGTIPTYTALFALLADHPTVQELLLDLLTAEEAAELGNSVYWQHHQRSNMKRFIQKLSIAYRHQPAYHARVLRELETVCADPALTADTLHGVAVRLFKHNQHLLEEFVALVPGVEPPESLLPSPETVQYHDTDSDGSQTETIIVQPSPEPAK